MAGAGHSVVISVSSDDISYSTVDGVKDFSFDPNNELLDVTDFADGSARVRIAGLFDNGVTLSGDYERTDTGAALIRTQFAAGSTIYIKILTDGTNGFKATTKVESFSISGSVDSTVQFSATFKGIAAYAVV